MAKRFTKQIHFTVQTVHRLLITLFYKQKWLSIIICNRTFIPVSRKYESIFCKETFLCKATDNVVSCHNIIHSPVCTVMMSSLGRNMVLYIKTVKDHHPVWAKYSSSISLFFCEKKKEKTWICKNKILLVVNETKLNYDSWKFLQKYILMNIL